eukprot:347241-Chlamydomonas_euryale.AAC.6
MVCWQARKRLPPPHSTHQLNQVVTLGVREEALHQEHARRPGHVHDLATPFLLCTCKRGAAKHVRISERGVAWTRSMNKVHG